MDLDVATQAVVDRLTAAGLRAVLNEQDVNPPCVFVGPPAIGYRFRRGDYEAAWPVWCVVPNTGRGPALRALGPLLSTTVAALGVSVVTADPADLIVADLAAPLPGYRFTYTSTITQPKETTQ